MNRIVFTLAILFVFRLGSSITIPGVTVNDVSFSDDSIFALMNLLGGGALSSFSIFALGVSPYITAGIIIQLLSMDVLPALSELNKQGQTGRRKSEMATRYYLVLFKHTELLSLWKIVTMLLYQVVDSGIMLILLPF